MKTIFIYIILSLLSFTFAQEITKSTDQDPSHPDSIGVGTKEYQQGEMQAQKDFTYNVSEFSIVGLVNLSSSNLEKMKLYFEKVYNLELNFDGCEGGSNYINGYNDTTRNLINEKYNIDLNNEIRNWLKRSTK